MRLVAPFGFLFRICCAVLLCVIVCGLIITAHAGIRGPGKYCGVVVFDRWDTCFLLSGHYITYISDSVKDELRRYQGHAMQIDASEVLQPMNPGDALVRKYEIIGPAPDADPWLILDGLEFIAESDFSSSGALAFQIEIRNIGNRSVEVHSDEIGPALLGTNQRSPFSASDGRSVAWITRTSLLSPSSCEWIVDGVKHTASYAIDPKVRPPDRFELEPGQSRKARMLFEVPAGEYQLIVGYGGGVHAEKSLASNAISFDVNEAGIATLSR
jgi:hypothetical protein